MLALVTVAALLALVTPVLAQGSATPASPPQVDAAAATRAPLARAPRIGLVLSGGGARGLAHVGVLKVLERARVPIAAIAGTSMGAIIGGLYASGVSADELERELLALDWDALFATRVPRASLAQRRKEEDFDVSPAIELGIKPDSGELMLPLGGVSSRGLELLLRRYTLPVRRAAHFDALPIPFRAVATDMETGAAVVFDRGDLATALRASMSVPGVFAPLEVDGRILGDGGLVNNLPVDVVRAMGVDVVIAVNIGTPLQPRATLGTVSGVTLQMINILTEQNVARSLAQLDAARGDILLVPPLGSLSSSDFARAPEFMLRGERQATLQFEQLAALGLSPEDWAVRRQRLAGWPAADAAPVLVSVTFEGQQVSRPQVYASRLASRVGQPFDARQAESDSRALAANDDYQHTDYRLVDGPDGTGLVFQLDEKPWGPNYFRAGLELASDFAGRGEFNVKLSHNRHWLNAAGGEWRNRLQIGSMPRWSTEWYQPLTRQIDPSGAWFASLHADGERRRSNAYRPLAPGESGRSPQLLARYARSQLRAGFDIGQPWGRWGELRSGLSYDSLTLQPELLAGDVTLTGAGTDLHSQELSWRGVAVIDQLDYTSFPTQGYRVRLVGVYGRRSGAPELLASGSENFRRVELDITDVHSVGRFSLDGTLRLRYADQSLIQPFSAPAPGSGNTTSGGVGQYTLGGFHNLSGYETDQLSGNQVVFGRLTGYLRLNNQPVLTRGFFAGATVELGNTWERRSSVRWRNLRSGYSVFLGADTGLGPFYLGLTWAPKGSTGVYLQLGRP
ncbi:MAG: patatin-like phospholipase family protein [Burkholderiales bacterium]|nr:patatin-like phospholipase family protein [Burkholderiales bacterium]